MITKKASWPNVKKACEDKQWNKRLSKYTINVAAKANEKFKDDDTIFFSADLKIASFREKRENMFRNICGFKSWYGVPSKGNYNKRINSGETAIYISTSQPITKDEGKWIKRDYKIWTQTHTPQEQHEKLLNVIEHVIAAQDTFDDGEWSKSDGPMYEKLGELSDLQEKYQNAYENGTEIKVQSQLKDLGTLIDSYNQIPVIIEIARCPLVLNHEEIREKGLELLIIFEGQWKRINSAGDDAQKEFISKFIENGSDQYVFWNHKHCITLSCKHFKGFKGSSLQKTFNWIKPGNPLHTNLIAAVSDCEFGHFLHREYILERHWKKVKKINSKVLKQMKQDNLMTSIKMIKLKSISKKFEMVKKLQQKFRTSQDNQERNKIQSLINEILFFEDQEQDNAHSNSNHNSNNENLK